MPTDSARDGEKYSDGSDSSDSGVGARNPDNESVASRVARGRTLSEQIVKAFGQRPISDLQSENVPRITTEDSLVASAEDVDDTDFNKHKREAVAKNDAIQNEILEAERDRLRQQGGHRRFFFFWSIAAISAVLAFNGFVFWWYMDAAQGVPSDPVLISWMSTSIVEVIGLGYIIARSLFQSFNGSPPVSNADKRAQGR